jgi:hypothetical protein
MDADKQTELRKDEAAISEGGEKGSASKAPPNAAPDRSMAKGPADNSTEDKQPGGSIYPA